MTTRDDLLARIEDQAFSPVRLREGYDMGEVDRFLDRLGAEISMGAPITELVNDARFTPVRMRQGYDIQQVDEFLDEVVATVTALADVEEPPPAVPTPTSTADPSSVISESKGFLRRRFGHQRR